MKLKITLMIVAALLAPVVVPLHGADQGNSQERPDAVAVAKKLMERARYCALVTIGPDGRAEARTLDAFPPEADMTVWLATNAASRKVEQIRNNPHVTLFYWDQPSMGYVTVIGDAALVDEPAEKAKRWKPEWSGFYSDANRGADYLLIRVRPLRLEIVSFADGLFNDPATGRPVQHQFR
ncbi:MAG: pyridoxamine 5'-phosphate oxidase family protein [Candidatus Eisenbacteria bacterium]